jgi:hypothetical protein
MFHVMGVSSGTHGDSTYVTFYFYTPFQLNQPISTDTADISYTTSMGEEFAWDAGNNGGRGGVCYFTVTAYDQVNHTITGSFYGSMADDRSNGNRPNIDVKNGAFNVSYTTTDPQ